MAGVNLYRDAEINPALSPQSVQTQLTERIKALAEQGMAPHTPQMDVLLTARAILANEEKRVTYDDALYDPNTNVTLAWIRNLARQQNNAPVLRQTPMPPAMQVSQHHAQPHQTTVTEAPSAQHQEYEDNTSEEFAGEHTSDYPRRSQSSGYLAGLVLIVVVALYALCMALVNDAATTSPSEFLKPLLIFFAATGVILPTTEIVWAIKNNSQKR